MFQRNVSPLFPEQHRPLICEPRPNVSSTRCLNSLCSRTSDTGRQSVVKIKNFGIQQYQKLDQFFVLRRFLL
jgi:hypothetical protein